LCVFVAFLRKMATDTAKRLPFSRVTVHPLALLSVVDHYNRVNKDIKPRRVVGILLGSISHGIVDVLNCYAVPFEEDGDVWFLDHNFHEQMARMCRKVNAKETVVGWYSTGPKIRSVDIQINELISKYTPNPVFLVVDVNPQNEQLALPMEAFVAVEELNEVKPHDESGKHTTESYMKFSHLPFDVATLEAEDIGVEHLLRDIPGRGGQGTISERIAHKERALRALQNKLLEVKQYLVNVVEGRLPPNQKVLDSIQDMFNMLPKVTDARQYTRSFTVENNDLLSAVYLGALTRVVISLHELILNKFEYHDAERKADEASKKTTATESKPDKKEDDKEAKAAKEDDDTKMK